MIARLVRSHLAHWELTWAALFVVVSLVINSNPVAATVTISLLVLLGWRTIPPRPALFEVALPVRGREVMMARALATLALMLLPMTVLMIVALFDASRNDAISSLVALSALGVTTALLPYHVNRGSLPSASFARHVFAWGALVAVGGAAIWLLPPATAAWLLTLGAAACVAVLWVSIPDALQLAPALPPEESARDATASPPVATREVARETMGTRAPRALAALRATVPWRVAVSYPLLIAMTTLGNALIFFCVVVVSVHSTVRARTRWLAALPLAHRARLLAVVLPSVLATTACVGLGAMMSVPALRYTDMLTRDAPSTSTAGHYYSSPTAVSIDHWRRVQGASAPVITAPWGERAAADTATVLGVTLYNPYTSLEHSSARFVAWQFARATSDVYGRPLTQAQYDTMSVYPRRYDGGPRAWLVNAAGLLTFGLVIVLLLELGWSHRLRPGSVTARLVPWLAMLPIMVIVAAQVLMRVRNADAAMPLLRGALRAVANELPGNPVAALVVAALPVALAYALLERQFTRSESAQVAKASEPVR